MNKSEGKAAQETSVLIGCSENVYVEVQTCMSKYKLYFDVQIYTSKCILYLCRRTIIVLRRTFLFLTCRSSWLSTQMVRHSMSLGLSKECSHLRDQYRDLPVTKPVSRHPIHYTTDTDTEPAINSCG